jgi:hypothetical protein
MKMGRRLRDVGEASSLCSWEEAKRGRFAYTALPAANFDRNAASRALDALARNTGVAANVGNFCGLARQQTEARDRGFNIRVFYRLGIILLQAGNLID